MTDQFPERSLPTTATKSRTLNSQQLTSPAKKKSTNELYPLLYSNTRYLPADIRFPKKGGGGDSRCGVCACVGGGHALEGGVGAGGGRMPFATTSHVRSWSVIECRCCSCSATLNAYHFKHTNNMRTHT
jgi:hypothetical protein